MLVDSHCHLPLMEAALEQVFATAKELDVGHMLCVSVDLDTFPQILSLARKYPHVFASMGIHPNTETVHEPDVEELVKLASDPEVVAIGETGLDYYRSSGDLAWQRDRFRAHIRAAKQINKPLIIHSREAGPDMINILREEGADSVGGVMHCFVDDWQTAQQAMDLNFYISFSGIVTFKNAQQLQEVARRVPLDRMLIETDSPYLAPVPYRGKPNQPGYVHHVAKFLAELRGDDFATLAQQTTDNFFKLFSQATRIN
jgi:TatD DNase family protein